MLQAETELPTPWLTRQEAARRVKLSSWTISSAIRKGELVASGGGHGRQIRIHIDELDAWMHRRGSRNDG